MKVVVLADTHTRGTSRVLPSGAWPYVESADHILHAGDVCDPVLLDELASFAPVTVVRGNCDALDVRDWGAADEVTMELDGVTLAMVHDSGLSRGRCGAPRQGASPGLGRSSSLIRTCRSATTKTASCCSTPGALRGRVERHGPRWAFCGSRTEISKGRSSPFSPAVFVTEAEVTRRGRAPSTQRGL